MTSSYFLRKDRLHKRTIIDTYFLNKDSFTKEDVVQIYNVLTSYDALYTLKKREIIMLLRPFYSKIKQQSKSSLIDGFKHIIQEYQSPTQICTDKIDNNYFIQKCMSTFYRHTIEMNNLFLQCLRIVYKFPPKKNCNKMFYGELVQRNIIRVFKHLFYDCKDLDQTHKHGSEYKNDCILYLDSNISFYLSIKAKKNKNGDIILINKKTNKVQHNLQNMITLVVIIETCEIIMINHNEVVSEYIKNDEAMILYKNRLLTFIRHHKSECVYKLNPNEEFINFKTTVIPTLKEFPIYEFLDFVIHSEEKFKNILNENIDLNKHI
jgi:hypothetical protein